MKCHKVQILYQAYGTCLVLLCAGNVKPAVSTTPTKAADCVIAAVQMAANGSPMTASTGEEDKMMDMLTEEVRKKLAFGPSPSKNCSSAVVSNQSESAEKPIGHETPKETTIPDRVENKNSSAVATDSMTDQKTKEQTGDLEETPVVDMASTTDRVEHEETKESLSAVVPAETAEHEEGAKADTKIITPSIRMRDYLQNVKKNKGKHNPADTDEKPAAPASYLPAKPSDWGQHKHVTANEQEVPKPRGRKPKKATEVEEGKECSKGAKPKASSKPGTNQSTEDKDKEQTKKTKRTRKAKATPKSYEPLEPEADVRYDKGAAFDAYAAASANADAYTLATMISKEDTKETHLDEPKPKDTRKRKRSVKKEVGTPEKNLTCEAVAGTKRKAKNTHAARATKKIKANTEATSHPAAMDTPAEAPASTSSRKPAPAKSAEAKARYSRKSCAYKSKLKEMISKGESEADAKIAARKVTVDFA